LPGPQEPAQAASRPRESTTPSATSVTRPSTCATTLERGWPIATGIIEGACRHLVKDRLDITGARWGLPGAEAVLKLRGLRANGDFDTCWSWHEKQEFARNHQALYRDQLLLTS
jgi:hypothetical protein